MYIKFENKKNYINLKNNYWHQTFEQYSKFYFDLIFILI